MYCQKQPLTVAVGALATVRTTRARSTSGLGQLLCAGAVHPEGWTPLCAGVRDRNTLADRAHIPEHTYADSVVRV